MRKRVQMLGETAREGRGIVEDAEKSFVTFR